MAAARVSPVDLLRLRLDAAMRLRNMGVTDLAKRSGYEAGYISSLRKGRRNNPTLAAVWALAGALEVEPLWLLGGPDAPSEQAKGRLRPDMLPTGAWHTVERLRAEGLCWREVVARLRLLYGFEVHPDSLRKMHLRKNSL